ncbi:MAG: 30S ribosomal protein S16 [Candidatus Acetothermia bacterium]|jgi:small subunit ribosomal protein S16|nr:30S ribosomal protein S16 [Candidatus Acetothermia bacterium]
MAARIRLMRVGKRKQPSYRVVVVDAAEKRDGRTVAEIGYYNPLAQPAEVAVDVEAALAWLQKGAQPTPAARRLLSRSGVMRAWHEARYGRPKAEGDAG